MRRMGGHESPCWYDDHVSFMSDMDSPQQATQSNNGGLNNYTCKKEFNNNHHHHQHQHLPFQIPQEHHHLIHLPLFENSKMLLPSPHSTGNFNNSGLIPFGIDMSLHSNPTMQQIVNNNNNSNNNNDNISNTDNNNGSGQDVLDQVTDWRVLDKFVASQLSHEDVVAKLGHDNNNNNYSSSNVAPGIFPGATAPIVSNLSDKVEDSIPEKASTPTSSNQIDVWKS